LEKSIGNAMSENDLFDIERLRAIGRQHWDPVARRSQEGTDPGEYDAYILQAAGLALRGGSITDVRDFLLECSAGMGVETDEEAAARAAGEIVLEVTRATQGDSDGQ
jgi:hypothetical protein